MNKKYSRQHKSNLQLVLCVVISLVLVDSCGKNEKHQISEPDPTSVEVKPSEETPVISGIRLEVHVGDSKIRAINGYKEMLDAYGSPASEQRDGTLTTKTYYYEHFSVRLHFPSSELTNDEDGTIPVLAAKSEVFSVLDGIHLGSTRDELLSRISRINYNPDHIDAILDKQLEEYTFHYLDEFLSSSLSTQNGTTGSNHSFLTIQLSDNKVCAIEVQFGSYSDSV